MTAIIVLLLLIVFVAAIFAVLYYKKKRNSGSFAINSATSDENFGKFLRVAHLTWGPLQLHSSLLRRLLLLLLCGDLAGATFVTVSMRRSTAVSVPTYHLPSNSGSFCMYASTNVIAVLHYRLRTYWLCYASAVMHVIT